MDLPTAQRLIRDDRARFAERFEAAIVIADDPTSSRDDLLACVRRGGHAMELASTRLGVDLASATAMAAGRREPASVDELAVS